MNNNDFSVTFSVDNTPEEVFQAINNVRGWWSGEFAGEPDKLGAEFVYKYKDLHHSKQKVTEFVPGKRVVWHVEDATLSFLKDKGEWKNTDIIFDIVRNGDKTEVNFTHKGLVPTFECYDTCSNAWGSLITTNLRKLIITGKEQPNVF